MDQNSNPSPEVQQYTAQHLEDLVNSWHKDDAMAYSARGVDGLSPEAFQQLQTQLFPKLNPPTGATTNADKEFSGNAAISEASTLPGATGKFGTALSAASAGLGQEKAITALNEGAAIPETIGLGVSALKGVRSLITAIKGTSGEGLSALTPEVLRGKAGELVADRAVKLEQRVGGFGNDMENGAQIQAILKQKAEAARKVAGGAFEALKDMAPNTQAPAQNLLQEVYNQSIDLSQLPKSFQTGKLATFIKSSQNALSGGEEAHQSLKQMMALRQELSEIARKQSGVKDLAGQTSNMGRQAYILIDALDKDIKTASSAVGAEDFAKAYDSARKGWKTFKDTFSNPVVEDLVSREASTIGNAAFKTPEHINALRAAGGEEAVAMLRKSVANDIMTKVGNTSQPWKVFEQILAQKPDEIGRLFTPKDINLFRDYLGARELATKIPKDIPSAGTNSELGSIIQRYAPHTWQKVAGGGVGTLATGALFELGKKAISHKEK